MKKGTVASDDEHGGRARREADSRKTSASTGVTRIDENDVAPGTTSHLELRVARLVTGDWLSLPVAIVRGAGAGPRLWLSATLHGDELNGMEIIRRVLQVLDPEALRGTVFAVPVVNVFGFINQQRYLPDRRDLNRSFPGSKHGSLAARLAHLFTTEIVERCEFGIDYHTGSLHRENLPQIRAHLEDPESRRLAEAFAAPMTYQAPLIRGSLRALARRLGIHLLLFEGGQPMRFDEDVIASGVTGTLRVLDALGMRSHRDPEPPRPSFVGTRTSWVRAGRSGILRLAVELGQRVVRGQILAHIARDFFTDDGREVVAPFAGLVISHTRNPLVNQGDALVHLARGREPDRGKAT